jgi:hypothetical protein
VDYFQSFNLEKGSARTIVSEQKKQWITFKVSALEMEALEAYCQQTQRTKTDVLRELIRTLETYKLNS